MSDVYNAINEHVRKYLDTLKPNTPVKMLMSPDAYSILIKPICKPWYYSLLLPKYKLNWLMYKRFSHLAKVLNHDLLPNNYK
jgi:hypothetical protein